MLLLAVLETQELRVLLETQDQQEQQEQVLLLVVLETQELRVLQEIQEQQEQQVLLHRLADQLHG